VEPNRPPIKLEEQCRENPEQRERPQDEADDGLEDRAEHEHRQAERVPKKPQRPLEKIVGRCQPTLREGSRTRGVHGGGTAEKQGSLEARVGIEPA
jgi:hypothetical protein